MNDEPIPDVSSPKVSNPFIPMEKVASDSDLTPIPKNIAAALNIVSTQGLAIQPAGAISTQEKLSPPSSKQSKPPLSPKKKNDVYLRRPVGIRSPTPRSLAPKK